MGEENEYNYPNNLHSSGNSCS